MSDTGALFYTEKIMSEHKIIAPDIKEGIDRKLLKNLKERFLSVNEGRLQRTQEALSQRHRAFLHVLPLLLHVNHASLPGYVSPRTPAGVRHFTPTKDHLRAAHNIARAFAFQGGKPVTPDIVGIYLMGSTGTIAQSEKSDLDFWICHRPHLEHNALAELRRKLDALSEWADQMGLEAHFFLMDPDKFKRGERGDVSGEDCGSAQHYLLLDEFYRSSLVVAGCVPLWWMVPVYEERNYDAYARELLSKRFIVADEFVDFGGISDFPAGEFVGAGMWQLYKGIDSPYKSVLKIVLTEVYASEHPQVECLSLCFKKAVYHGQTALDELDPYVMMYRKIEHYLQRRQEDRRLELIRHCFYFKVNEALSRDPGAKARSWRYTLMEHMARVWNWDNAYLRQLDNRKQWRVTRVRQERQELVYELNYSYRLLSTFARENNIESSIRQEDMHLLGRRLHAAFERKGGKIEMVNPGITSNLEEEALSLLYMRDEMHPGLNDHWATHRGYVKIKDAKTEPLRKSRSLIEMLAWCYFNKLIDHSTRVTTDSVGTDLNDHELQRLVQHFFTLYPNGLEKPAEQAFRYAAYPVQLTLFINVGLDPLRELTKRGIHRLSNHTDALSYSAMHHNLVLTVDQIMINSWGEVLCTRYDSSSSLMDCLLDYLRQVPADGSIPQPKLQVRCECPTRAAAIAARVEELFNDVITTCYATVGSVATTGSVVPRYVLEIEQRHYLLQFQRERPVMQALRNTQELVDALGEPQPAYTPIVIDRHALARHPLREVIRLGVAGRLQVFFLRQGDSADIYVHDENGSVFHTSRPWRDEASLLTPLQHFFESLYLRRRAISQKLPAALGEPVYYELLVTGAEPKSERRKSPTVSPLQPWHNVQAIADTTTGTDIYYTIYCDNEEFSQLDHGEQLYTQVARFITTLRRNQARYPCYITDLDLTPLANSRRQPLSTCDYLRHKDALERAINAALQKLSGEAPEGQ